MLRMRVPAVAAVLIVRQPRLDGHIETELVRVPIQLPMSADEHSGNARDPLDDFGARHARGRGGEKVPVGSVITYF